MSNQSPFPTLKNDLILRVIRGEKVDRPPVWIMRQAGRYLPEFQEVRKKYEFFDIVTNPELACKITLQPIQRYGFDAAIIFSDILIVCQAMGFDIQMIPQKGPVFKNPLSSPKDFDQLKLDVDIKVSSKYLMDAIYLTRHKLDGQCPLIGFAGAPWTLMAYMTESSKGDLVKSFNQSRRWLYQFPKETLQLLDHIARVVSDLLVAQAESGAQLLMLFESHGEVLNRDLFITYSYPFLTKIYSNVRSRGIDVPMIIFAKGCHYAMDLLVNSPFEVIGIDWTVEPELLRKTYNIPPGKTLMGNLDPAALYASEGTIKSKTIEMLDKFKGMRHICNLGHGVYPDIPLKAVETFVQTIKAYSY